MNYLIDLKQAIPSTLQPFVKNKQPRWESEAHRVTKVQHWAQAISPAFLAAVTFQDRAFIIKGLQPSQDRLALEGWKGKPARLEQVISDMGELIAWSHLRSSGRSGSSIADDWIAFGSTEGWQTPLLEYATGYASKAESDWKKYCREYDKSGTKWTASPKSGKKKS